MHILWFVHFLLKFFLREPRTGTFSARAPRTRSAAALAAPGESPFQLGASTVSPGAPLRPPDADTPAEANSGTAAGKPSDGDPVDRRASAETLFRRARALQQHHGFAAALPWWKELSNRKESRRYQADAWYMRCLFELGDRETARFLYDAPDATRDTLQVAGQFLVAHKEWESGLALWRRLHCGTEEQSAEASFYLTACLLNLARTDEAEALYTGRQSTVDALKAACDFFHQRKEFERVLPMWTRLQKTSRKYGGVARAGVVACHLEMGQVDVARELYERERASVEVLRVAAMHFFEKKAFACAQPLFQRIVPLAESDDEADTADAYVARCKTT